MVSIKGLDKADVLKALYDASHAQGLSFLGLPKEGVSLDVCREAIASGTLYFDYWRGHVLKVDLSGDEFDPRLFDRDNYQGAASDAILELRTRPVSA